MAKNKIRFECSECGYTTSKWLGSCPSCSKWNTFIEVSLQSDAAPAHKAQLQEFTRAEHPQKLEDISVEDTNRMQSGISEFDRVLGGGFVRGSFVLLGGDPGVGKSTLMLQLARGNEGLNILYCSGEESAPQIKQRAKRLTVNSKNLWVYPETELSKVMHQAGKIKPDLLIVDSIQTMYRTELTSMPGSIQQVKECAAMLQKLAKTTGITTLIIGHITKKGDLAGPRILEHMVDTVLQFEGDENYSYRMLRSLKNRFGPAQEIGIFEMLEQGLSDIENPSDIFISEYDNRVSGNALVCTIEGSRPLIIEVQALVTPTSYSVPQRTTTGFDTKKLSLLLAVLEKRCGVNFSNHDVYLNVAGGIKLTEPGCDLGIACALVSSMYDKPIRNKLVFIGEIGLGAEVRSVNKTEQRLNELNRVGMKKALIPQTEYKNLSKLDLEVQYASYLKDALKTCFI